MGSKLDLTVTFKGAICFTRKCNNQLVSFGTFNSPHHLSHLFFTLNLSGELLSF